MGDGDEEERDERDEGEEAAVGETGEEARAEKKAGVCEGDSSGS